MRRRSILQAVGRSVVLGSLGVTAGVGGAHPTATSNATPPAETPTSEPLSTLDIQNTREAVLDEQGTTAYVATVDGFAVVDAADPTDLSVLASETVLADRENGPLTGIWDLHVDGDRLLVAGPANSGPSLRGYGYFDVSDPSNHELLAARETNYSVHNCFLQDGVAYVTGSGLDGSPLVIFDPATGAELARWSVRDVDPEWVELPSRMVTLHDIWVHDGHAYLAYWDAGTWCLDVSTPSDPTLVSRVRGRPLDELRAVEDSNREATTLPGNDHFVTVDEAGDLLGIGGEAWAADAEDRDGPAGIEFYDVSDPTAPTRLGGIDPPRSPDRTRGGVWTTAHNFELAAGRCYASWYQGGVTVHDVTDPSDPVELFHWRDADRGKFWTAQLGAPGEWFFGASIGAFGGSASEHDGIVSGLFTFPDPTATTGEQRQRQNATVEDATTSATGDGLGLWGGALALGGLGAWCRSRSR